MTDTPRSEGDKRTGLADDDLTVTLNQVPLDTTVAHPARVYDYWLGGKDNFAADREAAQRVIELNPGIVPATRNNRAFLRRAVRFLTQEAGIRQFLDLGTGLPSFDNVHEVAQASAEDTRVVYVDNDPLVLVHARALLTGHRGVVRYIQADIREPKAILEEAAGTLDLDQPVAVLALMTMQFVFDGAYDVVSAFLDRVPSGSYLALSHPVNDGAQGAGTRATAQYNQLVSTRMRRRTPEEIARFFDGLELVPPGLVTLADWRPDGEAFPAPTVLPDADDDEAGAGEAARADAAATRPSPALCGVARKP